MAELHAELSITTLRKTFVGIITFMAFKLKVWVTMLGQSLCGYATALVY
jgi:hypothetical protein